MAVTVGLVHFNMKLLIFTVVCLTAVVAARRPYYWGGRARPTPSYLQPGGQDCVRNTPKPKCWIVCDRPTEGPHTPPPPPPPKPTTRPTRRTTPTKKRKCVYTPNPPSGCRTPPPPLDCKTPPPPPPTQPPRPILDPDCDNQGPVPPSIPTVYCFSSPPGGKIFSLQYIQQTIIDYHNHYRNIVAEGYAIYNDYVLPSASHMGAVSWDKDLAKMAKRFLLGAQEPTGAVSVKYPDFGIVHSSFVHQASLSSEAVILEGIKSWFDKISYLRAEYIESYMGDDYCGQSSVIGFLGIILNERSTRVGCAAVQHCDDQGYQYVVMCAYSSRTRPGEPIFGFGPPGSQCRLRDSCYPNLCAVNEPCYY